MGTSISSIYSPPMADMEIHLKAAVAALTPFLSGTAAGQDIQTLTGSGVVIGAKGEILTSAHVVVGCQRIAVKFATASWQSAVLIASDAENDFAVVRISRPSVPVAVFGEGAPL